VRNALVILTLACACGGQDPQPPSGLLLNLALTPSAQQLLSAAPLQKLSLTLDEPRGFSGLQTLEPGLTASDVDLDGTPELIWRYSLSDGGKTLASFRLTTAQNKDRVVDIIASGQSQSGTAVTGTLGNVALGKTQSLTLSLAPATTLSLIQSWPRAGQRLEASIATLALLFAGDVEATFLLKSGRFGEMRFQQTATRVALAHPWGDEALTLYRLETGGLPADKWVLEVSSIIDQYQRKLEDFRIEFAIDAKDPCDQQKFKCGEGYSCDLRSGCVPQIDSCAERCQATGALCAANGTRCVPDCRQNGCGSALVCNQQTGLCGQQQDPCEVKCKALCSQGHPDCQKCYEDCRK
jgi:hypothetical protein